MAGDLIGTPEDGVATPDEVRDRTVEALEREREGYKRRLAGAADDQEKAKLNGRIKAVSESIKDAKKATVAKTDEAETATADEPEAETATA